MGDPDLILRRAGWAVTALLVALIASSVRLVAATAMPGPSTLQTGFSDYDVLQNADPLIRAPWYQRARNGGSQWVRLFAVWSQIAPAHRPVSFRPGNPDDHAYHWRLLDADIRSAEAAGQHIVLTIFSAPRWASGPGQPRHFRFPGTWKPNAAQLGRFAHAIATRYDGSARDPLSPQLTLPKVSDFQVWNEPNLPSDINPQWTRIGTSYAPASPVIYRRMLNAGYAGITSAQPHAFVLAAATAPYGDPPGGARMPPITFLRGLMCLHGNALNRTPCPDPPHFDALAHNPYSSTPTVHAVSPLDVSVPDFSRIKRVLRVAQRDQLVLPRGPKQIWVTEIAWDSDPPDRHSPTSLGQQQRYLSLAFYQFWRQGISHAFWLLIRDYPHKSLSGEGLYFANAVAKPAAAAFRFPFVALRRGKRHIVLWGRAPVSGSVTIQSHDGRGWHPLFSLKTTRGAIFYVVRQLPQPQTLRAIQGDVASPGWATG